MGSSSDEEKSDRAGLNNTEQKRKKKKSYGLKGPNPLSVKKSKKDEKGTQEPSQPAKAEVETSSDMKRKRKRRKKKADSLEKDKSLVMPGLAAS